MFSRLHDLRSRRALLTVLVFLRIILESGPSGVGNNECGQVSVKLVPLESTILPEACTLCQEKRDDEVIDEYNNTIGIVYLHIAPWQPRCHNFGDLRQMVAQWNVGDWL